MAEFEMFSMMVSSTKADPEIFLQYKWIFHEKVLFFVSIRSFDGFENRVSNNILQTYFLNFWSLGKL